MVSMILFDENGYISSLVDKKSGRQLRKKDGAPLGVFLFGEDVPESYDNWDFDGTLRYEKLAVLGRKTGFIRFFYADSSLPPSLSEDDKKLYRAIACRIAVNDNVIDEGLVIPEAVKIIDSKPIPDIPMLMFVSNGEGTGSDDWVQIEKDFAAANSNVQMIELDCEHYVHNFEQEKIAEEISVFFQ